MPGLQSAHTVGCSPRALRQTGRLPHPLNHDVSICTLGSFFDLEAGYFQGIGLRGAAQHRPKALPFHPHAQLVKHPLVHTSPLCEISMFRRFLFFFRRAATSPCEGSEGSSSAATPLRTCTLFHVQFSLLLLDLVPQETGKVVWYSHVFKNFPVCCDPHS